MFSQNDNMDILSIPFHKYLNIEKFPGDKYIFQVQERPEYLNHLQTIHACLQLALAEASSGEFLLQQFEELKSEVIPVIRKTEAKYNRPANGTLYSRASFLSSNKENILKELIDKRRTLTHIQVEIFDMNEKKVLSVVFEWFLKKR